MYICTLKQKILMQRGNTCRLAIEIDRKVAVETIGQKGVRNEVQVKCQDKIPKGNRLTKQERKNGEMMEEKGEVKVSGRSS